MFKFERFLVGGAVRDELRGAECHDLDFTVEAPSFEAMVAEVERCGGRILNLVPDCVTLKAKDETGELGGFGLVLDFVLARRDSKGGDGRRPDEVMAGTLLDDLARRDFTVNAIARNMRTGELVDPFGGRADLVNGVLRAVGNPKDRFMEDALRVMRAFRFGVTLGFTVEDETRWAMEDADVVELLESGAVSLERKREELDKAFRADEMETMRRLLHLSPRTLEAFGLGSGLRITATAKA